MGAPAPAPRRRIAVTGATGLVGTALGTALRNAGHDVVAISRHPGPGGVRWDPLQRQIDRVSLQGVDAVVHLAGESIAGARWTGHRKALLASSRIGPTAWLADVLAGLDPRPQVLVSASAIGIYGSRGDELLDEQAAPGSDFLARLAGDWERAADPARDAGIRVVHPRFGIILSANGGALAKMLPAFRLGLGGPIGDGRQWMSWMVLSDTIRAITHLIATPTISGPVNVATPHPVRNDGFVHALGAALHRPALLPLPAFALRLAFGEMADATLLASQRVVPAVLHASGFVPRHESIGDALRYCL
jgi:uncharacterized protein (TIGR01777 family)